MGSSSPLGIPAPPPSSALSPAINASTNPNFLWTSGASSNHRGRVGSLRVPFSQPKWHKEIWRNGVGDGAFVFGSDEEVRVPTQSQSLVEGSDTVFVSEYKPSPDLDYLQELLAIQQQGPRAIGFFGT
ncbi:hypothetical protein IHE45_05G044300 [Dioscorea alata]|uniref:Uncharacterized protein n=1 Tax=Dioscorea alata TaxID=55571 RepID=A0ACB7W0I4_DIOAL|nr:hypothetical protein IHE45_05G044300 [Dioscorea alata]